MAAQSTFTFFSGGWGKHSFPPPVFKKVYTGDNIPLSEIVNREVSRKCDFIEIELSPKIQYLSYIILKGHKDFKDGIKSLWYCFDVQPLVMELLFSEDLETTIRVYLDSELWEKSPKIMRLFNRDEITITEDKTRGDAGDEIEGSEKNLSKLELSYFIDKESSSLVVKVYQSEQDNFSDLTLEKLIKSAKSMSTITNGLIKSIKNRQSQEPNFFKHQSQS